MAAVAFHFDYRSHYSYMAMTQIGDIDRTPHPFDVFEVMKRVGNTPTTITCKVKDAYASKGLGRWARRYGLPMGRHPQMREIDGRQLLRATQAISDGPERCKAVAALFNAMWAAPAPLAGPVEGDSLEALLDAANAAAAECGVLGSPTFFVWDEMFLGNDRLDFMRDAMGAEV